MLLTGVHPIFKRNDTKVTYQEKLKNLKWSFPNEFSNLAKDLFLKLARVNPLDRYTAEQALEHPWIRRIPKPIPLTYNEIISYKDSKQQLINVYCINILGICHVFFHWRNNEER